jgi:hypothetical protein
VRLSITMNATSSATAPTSTPIVREASQPYCGACEIPSTSNTRPAVPASAPSASNRRREVVRRLSGTTLGVSASAVSPIGTFE